MRDRHGNEYEGKRFFGAPYRFLIDAPGVLPILREILGDPALGHVPPAVPPALRPLIRLDHDNIHYKPPSTGLASVDVGGGLHGSPQNWHATAVFELKSVPPGGGGLAVIPGSHQPKF